MSLRTTIIALGCTTAILTIGEVSAAETIRVALSTAVTGPVVQYGDMHRAGVNLAVENINSAGGVLGKTIEIIEIDDACNGPRTTEVANDIVARKIKFVLGPLCSGTVPAAAKIFNDNNTLMIASTASSDDLSSHDHSMFFRTIGKDEQQGAAAARYIADRIKPKKVAIIHENQAYGRGLAMQVKKDIEAGGFKPEMFEQFDKGGTDFSTLIARMKQADVDFVYYGGYHPELIVMLQQAKQQGLNARWMGPGGVASPAVKGDWAEGLLVTLPPDVSKQPSNAKIVAALRAKKQDPSGSFVMTSYASVQVLAAAINKVKSDDPVIVAEFMHNNKFETVLGEVAFTQGGDNSVARFDIFVWHKDASKTPAQ